MRNRIALLRFRHPVNLLIYLLLKVICRFEIGSLSSIPDRGPLILVTNHVTFLEVPILYTFLLPRRLVGITKVETWNHPVTRYLANLWKAIPIRRNSADMSAFMKSLEVLKSGAILAIAPEGTRSRDGKLQRGHAGVVTIAAMSGAPVLPVAHFGGERIFDNLRRLRKTRFTLRVGEPIYISRQQGSSKEGRNRSLEEIMTALARLMPAKYHGYYRDAAGV